MGNKIRKRYFVSQGDLFQLYADIQECRRQERREAFMADFKKLLRHAQEVELVIRKREGGDDNLQ